MSELQSKETAFSGLAESGIIREWVHVFHRATGLTIMLVPARPSNMVGTPGSQENPFCLLVRQVPKGCELQNRTFVDLTSRVIAKREPCRVRCFAQMDHWLIPIFVNGLHRANLYAGQVFTQCPTRRRFEVVSRTLLRLGLESKFLLLQKTWFDTPVISPGQFTALGRVLTLVARLIAEPANGWCLGARAKEPRVVQHAKHFVAARLHQPISLVDIARHVGRCPQYLSKLFKISTGISLMHYAQQARVERAKEALADPSLSIKQVAFMVGFASVADFDRVFHRRMGVTPSAFRRR